MSLNPVRREIIEILKQRKQATWSEIKRELEKRMGTEVNPNLLAFHLRKLVEEGLVKRYEPRNGEEPVYEVGE